jgi:siroheme synthase
MQGEAISLDNEKQATFKISGPGEPLQITMKSIAKVSKVEADEQILTSDVPDDVLERAASTEQNALTMLYCTSDWYSCGLPQIVAF